MVVIIQPIQKFYIDYLISTTDVVATTCRNSTCSMLTSAKLSVGYLVVGITRELDKEPSLHCSSIYINTTWFMLQQYIYLMSYYSSTMLLPQGHHAMFIYPDIILFNLCHHAYTMRNPCSLTSLLTLTLSRLFPILLDCSRLFQLLSHNFQVTCSSSIVD